MNKTYVIGIAGASASGKSTISENLKNKLSDFSVKIIHMDDYYKAKSQRPKIKGISDGKKYADDNHPDALNLSKCFEDIIKAINEHSDIVILDGIFALYDENILNLLDLKIYVDCDSDERMKRRILRHLSIGENFEEITERYIQAVNPRQKEYVEPTKWKADIIINGFSKIQSGVEIIETWLNKIISQTK